MEWKEFETTFSVKLNQQQKEAVQSTKGLPYPDQERPRYW